MSRADSVVELVAYDPVWPARFARARMELLQLVPGVEVEHIGSTSVPGLSSKDTIDIALGVADVAGTLTSEVLNGLGQLGYDYVPASFADDPHHAFLSRADENHRTEHLHVMTRGREPMAGHLLFRDFLRADPATAARYEREKQRLASLYRYRRSDYVRLKQPIVETLMVEARAWEKRSRRWQQTRHSARASAAGGECSAATSTL